MPYFYGTSGPDTLSGSSGADQISGVAGNDSLSGGGDNDRIYGGTGNDTLDGGLGDDTLGDGEGRDLLLGQSGNDFLSGGNNTAGFTLDGGVGSDTHRGGNGNDVYYVDSLFDSVDDPGGNDTAYVSASFVRLPPSIENVIYTNGALPLPYWIRAVGLEGNFFGIGDTPNSPVVLLGQSRTFGYAFPTTPPSYLSSTYTNGYTAFSSIQIARTEEALRYIESIIDVRFVQTTNAAARNVLSFASNTQQGSAGNAFSPASYFWGSDVFLNMAAAYLLLTFRGPRIMLLGQ